MNTHVGNRRKSFTYVRYGSATLRSCRQSNTESSRLASMYCSRMVVSASDKHLQIEPSSAGVNFTYTVDTLLMYDNTEILTQNERKQTIDYLIEQQRTKIVLQESRMAQSTVQETWATNNCPCRRKTWSVLSSPLSVHQCSCWLLLLLLPPQQEMCETWERTKKKTLIILRPALRPRSSIRKGFRHTDPIPSS